MGLFKSKTLGEKAKEITLAEVGSQPIEFQAAGNNRYLVITLNTIYVGSVGAASGSMFGGKKVKRIPVDLIVSADVRKSTFAVELEISFAGSGEVNNTRASLADRAANENIITFPRNKYDDVQKIANYILQLRQFTKTQHQAPQQSAPDIPAQIQQLSNLKNQGIISEAEFESKKAQLLSRM